jgi:hypothetical protein
MSAEIGERRLAQWMLDVGTPPTHVIELIASTAGLAPGVRMIRALDLAARAAAPAPRIRDLEHVAF